MQLNLKPIDGGGGPPELGPLQRLGAAIVVPLLVLILAVGQSVYYTVEPEEVGVVLTFGAFTKTTNPEAPRQKQAIFRMRLSIRLAAKPKESCCRRSPP